MLEESVFSVPSFWTTMTSWLTPTVLFVLLNFMIGIIAISSSLSKNKRNDQGQEQNSHLDRYPSMLYRLKSINFYSYNTSQDSSTTFGRPHEATYQEPKQQPSLPARSPSIIQRLKSLNFYNYVSQSQEPTFHVQKPEETKTIFGHDILQEEKRASYMHAREEDGNVPQGQDMTLDEVYMQLKSKKYNRTTSDTKPASGELPPKLPTKIRKSASTKSAFSHFEVNDIVETPPRPVTVKEGTFEGDEEVDAKADDFINKFKQQLKLQRIDSIMKYKELICRGSKK